MNKPIVVAIVASNLEWGGAERQIVQIANGLDPHCYRVHVISLSRANPLAEHLQSHVTFHVVERGRPLGLLSCWRLRSLLRSIKASVVHGFLYDAEIFTRLASIGTGALTVIGSIRNSDYEVRPLNRRIKALTAPLMDLCISNSNAGIAYDKQLYGELDADYRLVRNGVDTERFVPVSCESRQNTRALLNIPADALVVGVFASFKAQKNHLALIQAAEHLDDRLPGIQYLFVGGELESGQRDTNTYGANLRKAIESSPIQDQFHMLGKRDDVERLYPCCDLTVLPSLHEGLPNVVLESIACATPFIATDVSDNAQLARDLGVGTIVPVNDIGALSQAMHRSLTTANPLTGNRLESVRDAVSRDRMIQTISEVYNEAHALALR